MASFVVRSFFFILFNNYKVSAVLDHIAISLSQYYRNQPLRAVNKFLLWIGGYCDPIDDILQDFCDSKTGLCLTNGVAEEDRNSYSL